MTWYRIYSVTDTFISNKVNDYIGTSQNVRITGSNFGSVPFMKIFKLTGSFPNSTVELARGLIKFDITNLSRSIYIDKIIPSSSINYRLKLFDCKYGGEVGTSFSVCAYPVTRSFSEGNGIDCEQYLDYRLGKLAQCF